MNLCSSIKPLPYAVNHALCLSFLAIYCNSNMAIKAPETSKPDGPNGQPAASVACDLSHHLNAKSKARHPSPLKDIIKFMAYDGMISLAGGMISQPRSPSHLISPQPTSVQLAPIP